MISFTLGEAIDAAIQYEGIAGRPGISTEDYSAVCAGVAHTLRESGLTVPHWIDPRSEHTTIEPLEGATRAREPMTSAEIATKVHAGTRDPTKKVEHAKRIAALHAEPRRVEPEHEGWKAHDAKPTPTDRMRAVATGPTPADVPQQQDIFGHAPREALARVDGTL